VHGIFDRGSCAADKNGECGITSECLGKQLALRSSRRPAISHHAGNLLPSQHTQRFLCIRNRQDFVAAVGQMGFDVSTDGRVMIHEQDAVRHSDHVHTSPDVCDRRKCRRGPKETECKDRNNG